MSGNSVFGVFGPDVRTEFGKRDLAVALDVEKTHQAAIEALPFAQGLPQIADGGTGSNGVRRLLCRGEGREVRAKGVHTEEITIW